MIKKEQRKGGKQKGKNSSEYSSNQDKNDSALCSLVVSTSLL